MIIYNNYVVVLILGIINMVVFLVMGLILVSGLFDFKLYHMYLLRFGAILNNCPRFITSFQHLFIDILKYLLYIYKFTWKGIVLLVL
jgi:hypothetical protein